MKRELTLAAYNGLKKQSLPAEAYVNGVLRGGFYNENTDSFLYSGSTNNGLYQCFGLNVKVLTNA